MFNFEDLKITYNRQRISIKDLVRHYNFKYKLKCLNISLNEYVVKFKRISLQDNDMELLITFNVQALSISNVRYIDKYENGHISSIEYYDDGTVKNINTKLQSISYFNNGNISSITRNGNKFFKDTWLKREFFNDGKIKYESILVGILFEYNSYTIEIQYYKNKKKLKEMYRTSSGTLHRLDGPSILEYDINGECFSRQYFISNNKLEINESIVDLEYRINNVDLTAKPHELRKVLRILSLNVMELFLRHDIGEDKYLELLTQIDGLKLIRKLSKQN